MAAGLELQGLGRAEVPRSGFLYESKNCEGRLAERAGYGFRIEFPEAVQGSMVVGYAAHFGMGEFETVEINM